jgi:hypothetical protein
MENSFDREVYHKFTVTKFVDSKVEEGQWVSLPLVEFAQLKDQVIAIESIATSTDGLDVSCPWIATWDRRELVGRSHRTVDPIPTGTHILGNPLENRFHGICRPSKNTSKWKRKHLPKLLQRNISDFFMSSLQARYMRAKEEILKKGSLRKCCPNNMKTYYADETNREGPVECFLLLPNNTGKPNDPVEDFLLEILENETTNFLMQQCSFSLLDRLCKYGVPIQERDGTFPPVVQIQHSRIDPIQVYGIVPVDAIKRMMMMCQVLEQQNYIYYIGPKENLVPTVYLYVPHTGKKKFSVTVTMKVQVGLSGYQSISDSDFPYDAEFVRHDPKVMAMTTILNCNKDPDLVEENMKDYKGIQSLRFPQTISFDLQINEYKQYNFVSCIFFLIHSCISRKCHSHPQSPLFFSHHQYVDLL